jgi:hypothetical protein
LQLIHQVHAERIEKELPRDGEGEVPARQLDEQEISELDRFAKEREIVRTPSFSFLLSRDLERARRLTQQIERDVREGDVFLENGPVSAPFGEPMSEDQPVIAEPESEFAERAQNPFRPRGIL